MTNLKRYYNRKEFFINLLGGKCINCGSVENLQFDHKDPKQKEFNISQKWDYKIDYVLKEMEKCQLLCDKCHKEKNKIDNGEAKHGTRSMYVRHKCRCEFCKIAQNEKMREYRMKKQHKCNDCTKMIDHRSIRCHSCATTIQWN